MDAKEIEKIYACYHNNYETINCKACEMKFLCEAWRKRDGANPLTMRMINPDLPAPSAKFPEIIARTVA